MPKRLIGVKMNNSNKKTTTDDFDSAFALSRSIIANTLAENRIQAKKHVVKALASNNALKTMWML